MEQSGVLKWRFDVSTFRLIGRDLITDRVTALFELVKNCYDANATEVVVTFEKVGDLSELSSICIKDNGIGMSFEDIRDKWMVIGTSSKRAQPFSPEPIKRRCVGEKGIGRFAVDKLGSKVRIETKQQNATNWLNVDINWDENLPKLTNETIQLFTDIENHYSFAPASNVQESGTSIRITEIRDHWTKSDVERLIKEIAKLVSPFSNISYPMYVRIVAPEYGINQIATRNMNDVEYSTLKYTLSYSEAKHTQQVAKFDIELGKIIIVDVPMLSFGGVKMQVYYFDDSARRIYRRNFPNNEIDGIKIYRDGIITTPFAESNGDDDKKRDVLGIDKRLWRDIFNRVSSREVIGVVDITKEHNPNIIDATNRQDFVDNEEYRALKEFIIEQLFAVEQYKKYSRYAKKNAQNNLLEKAEDDVQLFISSVQALATEHPSLKTSIDPVIEHAQKTREVVKTAIKEKKEAEAEFARRENIYMSIMSLHEYAIHITHAVRTTLNKIRDDVFFFDAFYPDSSEEETFKIYAKEMLHEFVLLNKVIDYMLSYSQVNLTPEDVDISLTINEIFAEYGQQLKSVGIKYECSIPKNIILRNTKKQFFRDIIQNLIDNSIKALHDSQEKLIRCDIVAENDKLIIKLSDTGTGIPLTKREWVFGLYNTTTEEQGGGGIGLYIVRTRVESLKGKVFVTDSDFGTIGTTIQIELPFKR